MSCIYTKAELISKIQAIDTQLESAVSMSSLDSGQGKSTFQVNIQGLNNQRNRYCRMLQQFYPSDYSQVININGVL